MIESVLFVCLGNICRSPMAEAILRHKLSQEEWGVEVNLESAGTGDWHVGQLPDPRTIAVLEDHGITEFSRARQVTRRDLADFDLIVVMDEPNYADIGKWGDRSKVRFATEWLRPDSKEPVPDPYYGGPQEFLSVYRMLDEITDRILFDLKAERA